MTRVVDLPLTNTLANSDVVLVVTDPSNSQLSRTATVGQLLSLYSGSGLSAQTFEYYSKNLKSVNNTIQYADSGLISNIAYSDGSVKTFYYNGNNFVVQVGIVTSGFSGNKYISYSNNAVSAITYGT